ncbi:MAG: histidine kinase dimerization/phospho-acceptor domain-containing protein [Ruminococcus sp.]|jgi:signal transduction histidine kinase
MEEKRWLHFYSKIAKMTTLSLQMLCVAGFVLSIVLAGYVIDQVGGLDDLTGNQPYWETSGCGSYIAQKVHGASQYAKYKPFFETEGKFDEEKTVDILNPEETTEKGKNEDTTFTVENLRKMTESGVEDELSYILAVPEEYFGSYEDYYGDEEYAEIAAQDVTKGIMPLSGISLEQQIQEKGISYGLSVYRGLSEILSDLEVYLDGRNKNTESNIKVYVRDTENGTVYTNVSGWDTMESVPDSQEVPSSCAILLSYTRDEGKVTFQSSPENRAQQNLQEFFRDTSILGDNEEALIALDLDFTSMDALREMKETYDECQPNFRFYVAASIICLILGFTCFAVATIQTGRAERGGEIRLNSFDRIPTEAAAVILLILGMVVFGFGLSAGGSAYSDMVTAVIIAVMSVVEAAIFMWIYLSLVRRFKAGTLWKNSLLRSIVRMCRQVYEARQTSGKIMILFIGFLAAHLIIIVLFHAFGVLLALIGDVLVLLYLVKECAGRQTIKEGLIRISKGELDYKIDLTSLKGENAQMAACVNSVGDGLQSAVKKTMKNERLKAELITNVSHDIKTPLTSIINYVDLLKRENIQDPKIKGYIDVLDAKSQRLKQLTDDLIEASKVSTGNVELHMSNLQVQQLLQQACGEFDDKLSEKSLSVMLKQAEEPVIITADGKQLWRIFENLLNNIYKYAMPGTRVYIDLTVSGGKAVLAFKNISEYPLNISADELTERFTRGDTSRSTQGSGLGLSIAKNLTELQGGRFEIYLDGDLFKVTLIFNRIENMDE